MTMTKEQQKISYKNWYQTVKYFKFNCEWFAGCILHHVDTEMKENDIERYIQWNPRDLQVMSKEDHARLHLTLNNPMHNAEHKANYDKNRVNGFEGHHHSEETKQKISNKLKGKNTKGHPQSEETRKKISEGNKGKASSYGFLGKHQSEEAKNRIREANSGWKYYNNGIICKKFHECPEGWVPGMLKRSK